MREGPQPHSIDRVSLLSGQEQRRRRVDPQIASLRVERDALVEWLKGRGHDVAESDANFVMFGRFEDRHAVWQALCERGILIRETGPAGFLRVSAGTPDEMTLLRAALDDLAPEKEGTTP